MDQSGGFDKAYLNFDPREREVVRCCQVVRCKIKLMQNRPSITTVSNFNKVVEVKQYYDVFGL